VSWQVTPRALVAVFGTLALSLAFTLAIGYPEDFFLYWILTGGFAWFFWVSPPPRASGSRWWYLRTTGQVLVWIWVTSIAVSLVLLFIQHS
jgi:hypothetical protein